MRRPILAVFLLGQSMSFSVAEVVTNGSRRTLMSVLIASVGAEQPRSVDPAARPT